MIRRHLIMSAALATIVLASCSKDDDEVSPTPTPTTSPTPTPTASPTYSAFPLAQALEFVTISAATSYTGDPAGAVTLGAANTDVRSDRVRLATSNAITTATYVIRENAEEARFVNANVTTAPAPSATEFVFRTTDTATLGKFSQLEFLNNTIPSQVTSDTGLNLTTLSYANWWRGDSATGAKRLTYTLFGYPTVLTDMPTTGTQAYASRVTGRLVSVSGGATIVQRVTGTVTTSVNFATGLVNLTLDLSRIQNDSSQVAIGTFNAQGSIAAGNNQFTGAFTQGSPLSGTISGGFYGSAGKEIGITFAGFGTNGGAEQRLVGVVVGKK